MLEYPIMNSVVNPEFDNSGYIKEFVEKHDHHFSVAIAGVHGLCFPIIRNVQEKSILDITSDLRNLIKKEKQGLLTSNDFEGGTF